MRYIFADPRPFQHQRDGLKNIVAAGGRYALLWEPGCGKTRPVLDYAGVLAMKAQAEVRVLVVCPKAVQDSWLKEAVKYVPAGIGLWAEVLHGSGQAKSGRLAAMGPADQLGRLKVAKRQLLVVGGAGHKWKGFATEGVTYERARIGTPRIVVAVLNLEALSQRTAVSKTKTSADLYRAAMAKFSPHLLVVDESHRIKSPTSNVSKLLRKMAAECPKVLLLTGTPMPHSPLDVWAQWAVLDPSAFSDRHTGRPWTFIGFRNRYAEMGGFGGKEIKAFIHLDDLQRRIAPRSMVLRKEDALDLPPTTDVVLDIELNAAEQRAYADLKKDLVAAIDGGVVTAGNRLTQMLRLRQITSGFVKDDTGTISQLGTSRRDAALSLLEDLLATENRIVVFAWARQEVDGLVAAINARSGLYGAKAFGITGDTPDDVRLGLRARFGDPVRWTDKQILVCQIRAMSIGVNELVMASHAIFLSLSQQRDDLIQAKGRLDRQGQTKPVTFWHLVAPGTVDEVILRSHRDRTDLESNLLTHLKKDI
jgi:SNF2 family DNA or RNA helicase